MVATKHHPPFFNFFFLFVTTLTVIHSFYIKMSDATADVNRQSDATADVNRTRAILVLRLTRNVLSVSLVLLCGDVSQNPGPVRIECSKCYKTIRKIQGRATCIRVRELTLKIQHKVSNLMENLFLPIICTSCLLKGISGMQFSIDANLNSRLPSRLFGTQETRANCRK